MPRKKTKSAEVTAQEPVQSATAVAERDEAPASRPGYIDGPPTDEQGTVIQGGQGESRQWGNPYKAIVTTVDFEMGENRRFKQRVFKFKEKPTDDVIAALKDAGFTYRAAEKAWTTHADADTRKISDELAKQFRGPAKGMEL